MYTLIFFLKSQEDLLISSAHNITLWLLISGRWAGMRLDLLSSTQLHWSNLKELSLTLQPVNYFVSLSSSFGSMPVCVAVGSVDRVPSVSRFNVSPFSHRDLNA